MELNILKLGKNVTVLYRSSSFSVCFLDLFEESNERIIARWYLRLSRFLLHIDLQELKLELLMLCHVHQLKRLIHSM